MTNASQALREAEALKSSVSDNAGSNEGWVARHTIQNLFQKVLILDLEYALDKKVEQDLWNYAFKNQITHLQAQVKDKSNLNRADSQASLGLFLENASGFYLQLLQELCSVFHLDLPFRRKTNYLGILKDYDAVSHKIRSPKRSSCMYICQHCLVHLGDIARYRQQTNQAQTYYRHAARLVPYNGQPYNQLAIIEAAKTNNKLSTIFYYMRSIVVKHNFPVAVTNLTKLYIKICKEKLDLRVKIPLNDVISALLQFFAFNFLFTDHEKAQILKELLSSALPTHIASISLSSNQIIQIVTICLSTLYNAKKKISSVGVVAVNNQRNANCVNSNSAGGGKAIKRVTIKEEKENINNAENNQEQLSDKASTDDGEIEKVIGEAGKEKNDEGRSNVDMDENENNKDASKLAEKVSGKLTTTSKDKVTSIDRELILERQRERYRKFHDLTLKFTTVLFDILLTYTPKNEQRTREYNTLPGIKMLLDWLRLNTELLTAVGLQCPLLWSNLSKLLNNIQSHPTNKDSVFNPAKYGWMALPEDCEVQCFLPLYKSHNELDFSRSSAEMLPIDQEQTLRCHRLLQYGVWLSEEFPSLNLMNHEKQKNGKILFSAPTTKVKILSGKGSSGQEKKTSRQNVAIQAIMQKKPQAVHTNTAKTKQDIHSQCDAGVSTNTVSKHHSKENYIRQLPPRLQKVALQQQQQKHSHVQVDPNQPAFQPRSPDTSRPSSHSYAQHPPPAHHTQGLGLPMTQSPPQMPPSLPGNAPPSQPPMAINMGPQVGSSGMDGWPFFDPTIPPPNLMSAPDHIRGNTIGPAAPIEAQTPMAQNLFPINRGATHPLGGLLMAGGESIGDSAPDGSSGVAAVGVRRNNATTGGIRGNAPTDLDSTPIEAPTLEGGILEDNNYPYVAQGSASEQNAPGFRRPRMTVTFHQELLSNATEPDQRIKAPGSSGVSNSDGGSSSKVAGGEASSGIRPDKGVYSLFQESPWSVNVPTNDNPLDSILGAAQNSTTLQDFPPPAGNMMGPANLQGNASNLGMSLGTNIKPLGSQTYAAPGTTQQPVDKATAQSLRALGTTDPTVQAMYNSKPGHQLPTHTSQFAHTQPQSQYGVTTQSAPAPQFQPFINSGPSPLEKLLAQQKQHRMPDT